MADFKDVEFKESDYIYTDTSAILQFLGYDNNPKIVNEVADLFAKARNANAPLVISQIVLSEILDVIIKDTFKRNGYNSQKDIKELREASSDTYNRLLGQALNDYNSYKHKITGNDIFLNDILLPSEETYEKRDALMFKHNIFGNADATHLALALEYGIEYFVTCDKDFKNLSVPDLTIICKNGNDT